ncbi:MAG TPA: rhodanese-like domain-containing protein, partial [Chromatiales bacterium]|nr:rhodanese-like domain-containing protein [Chromatiales bacterium]
VSCTQAVRLINNGAKIVDVRAPERFEAGHIVDSINIPLNRLQDDQQLPKKSKTVVVVCDRGVASLRGVDVLRKAGFEHAYSLRGGVEGWTQENLPLVTGK